jgi:hypothetical protein
MKQDPTDSDPAAQEAAALAFIRRWEGSGAAERANYQLFVLEKLRSGEALTAKEKAIHEQGLVSVLRQLHDDLDSAVFAAYGWPATLTDAEILERLVVLNAVRAALADCGAPATAADIARRFARVKPPAVEEILQTLVSRSAHWLTHFGRFSGTAFQAQE